MRQQDEKRLASLLSTLTGEKIGAHCRVICTTMTTRRQQGVQVARPKDVRAIHLECDSAILQFAKHKVAHLYHSSATTFPDGTKMCLIPPIGTIIVESSKEKYGVVVARQEAFTTKVGTGTSWEFLGNLFLDYKGRDSTKTVRVIIMDIQSMKFPGHPVFHSLDATWGSDNGVNFNFHPDNEKEARMYIAGLIPCMRDTMGEKYLSGFSADAIGRHSDSVFNVKTKQIYSNTDIWVHNSLALDKECNDSVSTFRSKHSLIGINTKQAQQIPMPTTFPWTASINCRDQRFLEFLKMNPV